MGCYNPFVVPKKYLINTYGCQANEADSAKIVGILEVLGMEPAQNLQEADLFIINSCSVRQKSEDKVYGLGKKLGEISQENPGKKPLVVLTGCLVGSVTGDRVRFPFDLLKQRTPWVDLYLPSTEVALLPDFLAKKGLLSIPSRTAVLEDSGLVAVQAGKKGYVNISYGCDNFCTYCVVPYARGKEISRSKEEILNEVNSLLQKGVTHITLCAQNVNSWGLSTEEKRQIRIGDARDLPFVQLLQEVHALAGIKQLSFISSNPFDFTQSLVETLKLPKIDPYLHIAVQSGNNDVLTRMNRRHTVEEFLDLVKRIKTARPDIRLGTDLIVGFPGETEDQFEDTVHLVQSVDFPVAFIAMYSERPGTVAAKFYKDDVSLKEKRRRHARLTKVWKETQKK